MTYVIINASPSSPLSPRVKCPYPSPNDMILAIYLILLNSQVKVLQQILVTPSPDGRTSLAGEVESLRAIAGKFHPEMSCICHRVSQKFPWDEPCWDRIAVWNSSIPIAES